MADDQISQHKRMAMGRGVHPDTKSTAKFARGGGVGADKPLLKTGMGTTPLTDARRANGIPGMKKGGKAK